MPNKWTTGAIFYNVFGMTRSLTGDWTRNLPQSKPALGCVVKIVGYFHKHMFILIKTYMKQDTHNLIIIFYTGANWILFYLVWRTSDFFCSDTGPENISVVNIEHDSFRIKWEAPGSTSCCGMAPIVIKITHQVKCCVLRPYKCFLKTEVGMLI